MVFLTVFRRKVITAILLAVISAACGITASKINAQTPSPLQASEQEKVSFFLTVQDRMLEGIPEERGDSWLIRLPGQTGGLLLSKLDIIFIGPTRESVFQFKKDHIQKGNIEEIAKLADWSARNRLAVPAVQLLKETAAVTDPEVSKVLQRQIERIEYIERLKKDAEHKTTQHSVAQKTEQEKDPEMKRLDSFAHQVPLSVQDTYVHKIQPILLRRCALSDCHQSGTPDMALTFVKSENHSSLRRGNLTNLEQVLKRVEFTAPTQSPILNHPEIVDLSGIQVFPFGSDTGSLKDFTLFSNWIVSLGGKIKGIQFSDPIPTAIFSAPESQKSTFQNISGAGPPRITLNSTPIDLTEGTPSPSLSIPKYRKITAKSALSAIAVTNSEKKITDEFDPIPFNKKYHPERLTSNEEIDNKNE